MLCARKIVAEVMRDCARDIMSLLEKDTSASESTCRHIQGAHSRVPFQETLALWSFLEGTCVVVVHGVMQTLKHAGNR